MEVSRASEISNRNRGSAAALLAIDEAFTDSPQLWGIDAARRSLFLPIDVLLSETFMPDRGFEKKKNSCEASTSALLPLFRVRVKGTRNAEGGAPNWGKSFINSNKTMLLPVREVKNKRDDHHSKSKDN